MTHELDAAARVVQQALTPVFLLSGVAALLNVFAARLARVADQAESWSQRPPSGERDLHLRILKLRSRALDAAVLLSALAGALTCAAVLVLFLGGALSAAGPFILFLVFGGAVVLAMCSLGAFVLEMLLASRGVRITVQDNTGGVI